MFPDIHVRLPGWVSVFCEEISSTENVNGNYPIISELYKVFNEDYDVSLFVNKVINF